MANLDRDVLAPRSHTVALIALIVAVALTGTFLTLRGTRVDAPLGSSSRVVSYLPLVVVEWGLTLYVCRIGRARSVLLLLIGERWTSIRRASGDLSIAFVAGALIEASEIGWRRTFGPASSSISAILPQAGIERLSGCWSR